MLRICGIDEAGRGPLAGPVTAAAVILPDDFPLEILADSKKLSARSRETAAAEIRLRALAWGIGWASHREIDLHNILGATMKAMTRAFEQVTIIPSRIVVDGPRAPDLPCPTEALVRADSLVPAVMAASILAKVARDRWMQLYAQRDPRYGFDRHKGYPTRLHREMVVLHGRSPIHRRSFRVS